MRGQIPNWGRGFLVGLSLWGGSALAQNSSVSAIDFQAIQSGGNGCVGGNAIDLYQVGQSGRVMIFFSDMHVDLKAKNFERKACSVSIPVDLPVGKRLVISSPAIFGASRLSPGGTAQTRLEVFLAGRTGPEVQKDLTDDEESRYFYQRSQAEVHSLCGAKALIRAQASLLGKGGAGVEGRALLEGIAVTLKVEDCPDGV